MEEVRIALRNVGRIKPDSIEEYIAAGGYEALEKARTMDRGELIRTIEETSRLRGRGGAAFSTGKKWSSAFASKEETKYLVCNADEGEPGTYKDRVIMEGDPHTVIEGLLIGAYAVGAKECFIYVRGEYEKSIKLLRKAVKQAEEKGFCGGTKIKVVSGAGAYVCGEGTALIRSIEGKAGRPRMKPPFIKVSGLFARPTCLNNVESLSLVPHLLQDKTTYMNCGTGESIGTKLISVAGNVNKPGVFEIPFGTTVREIIYNLAGGIQHDRNIQLIQFGGASGKVTDASILDTPYTYDDLRAAGVMVGSGGILVIDERTSVIDFLRMNQEFFSEESCGQCTPCREGNLHIKIILDKLAKGEANEQDIKTMTTIAKVMSMSSLCGLGETAQNSLLSAMKKFPQVFDLGGARA